MSTTVEQRIVELEQEIKRIKEGLEAKVIEHLDKWEAERKEASNKKVEEARQFHKTACWLSGLGL